MCCDHVIGLQLKFSWRIFELPFGKRLAEVKNKLTVVNIIFINRSRHLRVLHGRPMIAVTCVHD